MKLYRINALMLKYYYITLNSVDRIFDLFYWPVLELVVWGFTSAFIEGISEYNFLSMALGGVILWMFAWRSSQDVAVYVLEDFWSRTLYHLFSSPLQVSEYIISTMLFGIFRSLITFAFLVTLGYLVYSFNLFSIPLFFLATAIFLLTLFGWILGLFVTSLILRYGQRIQILAWSSIWLMQPFSAIFYPVSALPAWAVPIAKLLPTTHIFEALRSIISSGKVSSGGLWYAFIVELLLLAIMTLFLYNSFRKAQKSGRLVHGD